MIRHNKERGRNVGKQTLAPSLRHAPGHVEHLLRTSATGCGATAESQKYLENDNGAKPPDVLHVDHVLTLSVPKGLWSRDTSAPQLNV
jgi:hypothetical protein